VERRALDGATPRQHVLVAYPVAVVPGDGDAVAYCRQRFKSYDIRTQTYLGYDGQRHPCP
jgi:hypothetical protein